MAVAPNADTYAAARQNRFFTANDQTSADGNLTGQCVTLVKWFFQEMCDGFPAPFAARGDARYVGQSLVAQGLATEVAYADRREGDIICYEFGTYGHIAVQLSGGRVFEENVNWSGVDSKVVDGLTVHASRIGSESESWRASLNPHIYRLKNYHTEGEQMMVDRNLLNNMYMACFGRNPFNNATGKWDDPAAQGYLGRPADVVLQELLDSAERQQYLKQKAGNTAVTKASVLEYIQSHLS